MDADGKRQEILGLHLWLIYRVNVTFLPFQFHKYVDDMSGSDVSAAASTGFDVGDVSARLVLTKQPDQGIRISLSHQPRGKDTG